ncbi:sulfite exporter TauE/SafE family protein [Massilia sp. R2A-15]|uniref:sulfite exporter TauE/SafE family protein n=1 Tax=Massilia sp. R2A-15 TaxID=3064278 RepID=UPI0027359C81|nr:sulfite exporter TauE/SafE family protein [Massilia sp. R2A-15]WLI90857.1 sulfite exporter TauE/SafE family protein [Massilia sp. R2A-15]
MSGISLAPVFLVGLLGSVHCAGMCGGIVSAFSLAPARSFPVRVATVRTAPTAALGRVLAYNGGRIASYCAAGALAGGMAGGARALAGLAAIETAGYWLANIMLAVLGLYLMDVWRGLAQLERLGQRAWRRIEPATALLLPLDSPSKLVAMGALWGWLPCGMVYSVLLTATFSGSALSGAAVMAAFGLGTLPMLAAMGLAGARLRAFAGRRAVRVASGLVVLAYGLLGLARAANGVSHGWIDSLCVGAPGWLP